MLVGDNSINNFYKIEYCIFFKLFFAYFLYYFQKL